MTRRETRPGPRGTGEERFIRLLPQIEERLARAARGLPAAEADDFRSFVLLKLIDGDYRILRAFRGRASERTFLTVVVRRLLLDYRNHRWGKWRPSAEARRLGPLAIELERLIHCRGWTPREAVAQLVARPDVGAGRRRLKRIADRLPQRPPRARLGEEVLARLPSASRADERLIDGERSALARRLEAALDGALRRLSAEARLLLKLRYHDGMSVRQIARALGREPRPLYRRYDRLRRRLRRRLEEAGVGWRQAARLLGRAEGLTVDYRVET
ncbi:MAG: sigma-70 family RNA polymerase sigma factor [Acidobacteria bacterium]|nr:MAG: sigma-70 family RNA polymerase sigma factor [Acidobacteriota bacterium]